MMFSLVGSGWLTLAALFGAALFGQFTAPDASAAAGGAADVGATEPVVDEGAEPVEGEPAAAAAGAPAGAEPEDDDPEDAGLAPEVRDNPTRLRTRLRRTQRVLQTLRPIAERLRGPDGQLRDIDQVLYAAQQFQEIDRLLQRNPQLRQVLYGDAAPAADREPEETPFDEAALPFDTTTPEGRYFADLARRNHEMAQQIRRIDRRLEHGERRSTEESVTRHEETWKEAALAAAQQLPAEFRTMFVEAVYGRFFRAKSGNQLGSTKPQTVIATLLRGLKLTNDQRSRATHAAAARTAENNRRLPAAPRGGAPGGPARPEAPSTTRTVADVKKDFLARNAG